MECEVIELPNDVLYSKPEYKGRCILLIAKVTDANKEKFWLHCYKCGIVASLAVHTVKIDEPNIVSLYPSVLCPNEKCQFHYFIKNGQIINI